MEITSWEIRCSFSISYSTDLPEYHVHSSHCFIITGIEQGVFPREDKTREELEEERQLFYVRATRAMDELYLCSSALRRIIYGHTMPMEPSLFLYEIDKTHLRIIGDLPQGYFPRNVGVPGKKYRSPDHAGSPDHWDTGDRVFHEEQGYGSIMEVRESGEGPVLRIRFDTVKDMHFLGRYQSGRITKINTHD